jgi:hypothetical protein
MKEYKNFSRSFLKIKSIKPVWLTGNYNIIINCDINGMIDLLEFMEKRNLDRLKEESKEGGAK